MADMSINVNPARADVEALIRKLAGESSLDTEILIRQCQAESGFRQYDKNGDVLESPCGALGLMQLLRSTAVWLGVNPEDWQQNVMGGVRLMGRLLKHYHGDYALALSGYNWGQGHVDKLLASAQGEDWRSHLPVETQNYLAKILPPPEPPGATPEVLA